GEVSTGMEMLALVDRFHRPLIAIVGLLLAFVVALKLIKIIGALPPRPALLQPGPGTLAAASAGDAYAQIEGIAADDDEEPEPVDIREFATAQVMEHPDV